MLCLFCFLPTKVRERPRRVALLTDVKQKVGEFASENATTLLTAGGVVGTITTAVLAARGGYKYAKIETAKQWEAYEAAYDNENNVETIKPEEAVIPKKDMVFATAPYVIPPVVTGAFTITAIVMSNRMSAQKAAALAAAYGLAERNFGEYKAKVEEKLTGPKATQIDDELAQESVDKTPGSGQVVIVEGEVLCHDKTGGRYFNGTMEKIRQAVNTTNAEVFNHGFARLSFFYNELGLDETTWSDEVGFNMENLLELKYSTSMAPGNKPCIVIDFARLPKADFHPKYDG